MITALAAITNAVIVGTAVYFFGIWVVLPLAATYLVGIFQSSAAFLTRPTLG
jgi:uncharacterized membrane protein